MDSLWRGDEGAVQGKRVLASYVPTHPNYPNEDSLNQWESNGKSLVAQKLVQAITADDVLTGISVAAM
jgi:hypothetical protein